MIDERRGRKHSRKERVLDIVTKERLLALSEAGVLAGGGADGTGKVRYAGAGALAYHSEMMQIDANVYANNLDIQSVQSDPGYLVMYSGGSSAVDNVLRQNSGFGRLSSDAESYGGKIGLEKYWKDRMYGNSVKASYSYGHHYEKNAATVLKEYFAGGGYPAGTEADTTSAGSVSGRHYATVAFDLKDTPLKSVGFEVSGNFGDSRNSFLNASRSITEGVGGELRRHETTTADARDYQISSSLDWSNNDETFMHPEFNLRFNSSNSSTLSWTVDTLATSFDRRQLSSDGFGRSMNASAGFSFTNFLVNTEKHSLSLSYGLSSVYSRTRSRQLTLDGYGVEIPVEDLANTYDYTWNDFSNSIIARMSYSSRGGLSVFGILEAANTFQFDDERYPDHWSDRRNYWGGSSVLQVNYRGFPATASLHSSTPSIEQTRNRISDSNPMSLTGGNPDLESEYDLYMDMSYNKMIAKGLGSVMAKLSTHAGFRNIVSKTTYFSQNTILSDWDGYEAIAGSRLYTFENADTPSLSGSVTVLGRGLFLKRKLTASLGFGSTVSSRPLYYGDELMNTNDVSGNATLSLSWRPSRTLKFDAGATAAYSKSSDRTAGLLSESMSASCSAGMTVRFAKYGTVDASYSFHNIDFIGGAGTDYVDRSLNAAISWGFMKRSLTVSLQGINLLDTGSVFTNQVTAESSVQTWKPIYGRYVILSLKYLFRKKS